MPADQKRRRRVRVFAVAVMVFVLFAMVRQFGWATGGLVCLGLLLLAGIGWQLPTPRDGRHADPASQGWRGPTL